MRQQKWLGIGVVVTLTALAMPVGAYARHPVGDVSGDCLGALYVAAGTNGGLSTHWQLFVGGIERDSGSGTSFASAGSGYYFKSVSLIADGTLVAQYDGPWCV